MTTTNETTADTIKCCFCDTEERYGNNPAPFEVEEGERCCDFCNARLVLPARMRCLQNITNKKKGYGHVEIKNQKTGIVEKTYLYRFGNLEAETDSEDDSEDEKPVGKFVCKSGSVVESFETEEEMIEKKSKNNDKKEATLKDMLKRTKAVHTFQAMNAMEYINGDEDDDKPLDWFSEIGQNGTNYYKMIGKQYPEFKRKFGVWLMPVFYVMKYIQETPFKINGQFGDWSVGFLGSVWMDVRLRLPLTNGETRTLYVRVAFYAGKIKCFGECGLRGEPFQICDFAPSSETEDVADMTHLLLAPIDPRVMAYNERKKEEAEKESAARVKEQERLFAAEEKARKQREFEAEQREKERAWRARVEADRIVAETENIRKQTELMEQNRQLIAQREKERLAEAKAEKERKAKEAAERAAAKKAEKAAADAAKFSNKKK